MTITLKFWQGSWLLVQQLIQVYWEIQVVYNIIFIRENSVCEVCVCLNRVKINLKHSILKKGHSNDIKSKCLGNVFGHWSLAFA